VRKRERERREVRKREERSEKRGEKKKTEQKEKATSIVNTMPTCMSPLILFRKCKIEGGMWKFLPIP